MTRLNATGISGSLQDPLGGLTDERVVQLADPMQRMGAIFAACQLVGRPPDLTAVDRAVGIARAAVEHIPAELHPQIALFLVPLVEANLTRNRFAHCEEVAELAVALFGPEPSILPPQFQALLMNVHLSIAECRANVSRWDDAEQSVRAALEVIEAMPDQAQAACLEPALLRWEMVVATCIGPQEAIVACVTLRQQAFARLTAGNDLGDLDDPEILDARFQEELGRIRGRPVSIQADMLARTARQYWLSGQSAPLAELLARHLFEQPVFQIEPRARSRVVHIWVADGLRQGGEAEAESRARGTTHFGISRTILQQRIGQCFQSSNTSMGNADFEKAVIDAKVAAILVAEHFPEVAEARIAAYRVLATAEARSGDLEAGIARLREALELCSEQDPIQFGLVAQQLADYLTSVGIATSTDEMLTEADQRAEQAIDRLCLDNGYAVYVSLAFRTRLEVALHRGDVDTAEAIRTQCDGMGADPLPPRNYRPDPE